MLHAQSPLTLALDQAFPVSVEAQFLALGASAGSQTGNACTPGTDIEVGGKLSHAHIIDSSSELYPPERWTRFEAEVHGDDLLIYRVDGQEVLRFRRPQLDDRDGDAKRLLASGASVRLDHGDIALQAEGQPVWFRNIRLRPLESRAEGLPVAPSKR